MTNSEIDTTAMFTEDHPTWQKACSILIGMQTVLQECREQLEAIQKAHVGKLSAPGMSQRVQLGAALQEAHNSLSVEVHRVARASALTLPEGVR